MCTVMYVAGSNLPPHYIVLPVVKVLRQEVGGFLEESTVIFKMWFESEHYLEHK